MSADEIDVLHRYAKTSPIELIRQKAYCVLSRFRGIKVKDVTFTLDVGERTVARWTKGFSKTRLASIFSGLVGNQNAAKLTREQKLEIKKVLQQKPSVYGLPKEFWDVPQLKRYIHARFGTVYESARSYHFLLEFGQLSFKYPDKFSTRRNEAQIVFRMEEIYGEILPLLENPNWEVFCSDEVRMVLEAITRRAWLKKGEKTVLKVARSNEYQNYLGFLNQRSFLCHVFEIAWGKAVEVIRATAELLALYPEKRVCIIWDNAKCHKGKLVREALSKGGLLERVHLIALPPYAPDCNPIEHIWKTTKDLLSNHQDQTFSETKQKFIQLTNNQVFHYQI